MQVRFTKLKGVNINLFKGNTIRDMELIQPDVAVAGQIYTVPTEDSMIITASPIKGSIFGSYEWEYWIDGEEYGEWESRFNSLFKQGKYGDEMLIISAVCAGLFVCLILCCVCYCCRLCC